VPTRSKSGRLGRELASTGAHCVIGPGFSTWWSETPYASLAAMAQSAQIASELALDLATIPTVVWRHRRDLQRWAQWIATTRPPAIAVDLGTLKMNTRWKWALGCISYLKSVCAAHGYVPQLVISGPTRLGRISDAGEAWTKPTFLSSSPWRAAQGGRLLLPDLTRQHAPELSRSALFDLNLQAFDRAIATATEGESKNAGWPAA